MFTTHVFFTPSLCCVCMLCYVMYVMLCPASTPLHINNRFPHVFLLACSKLPDVPHAHVSDETKRSEFYEGNVIRFTCDRGYKSEETSLQVCTSVGWVALRGGGCYSELHTFTLSHTVNMGPTTKKKTSCCITVSHHLNFSAVVL